MDKPPFDPNKPYTPVANQASKPAFDPNQPFTPVTGEPDISTLGALVRGTAHGATAGWSPQIIGALEALSDETFKSPNQSFGDLYRQHRDESKANYEAGEKQHPYASLIGNVAGALVPAALTMGGSAEAEGAAALAGAVPGAAEAGEGALAAAAPLLESAPAAEAGEALGAMAPAAQTVAKAAPGVLDRMAHAAKMGAAYGAVQGAGDSNADLTQGDVMGVGKDAVVGGMGGALMGGLTSPLLDAAAPIVKAVAKPLAPIYKTAKEWSPSLIKDILTSGEYGAQGEKLTGGEKTLQKFATEGNKLVDSFDPLVKQGLADLRAQQQAAIQSGDPALIKAWADRAHAKLDALAKNYPTPRVMQDVADAKSAISDFIQGPLKTLMVPTVETGTPELDKLNKKLHVKEGNFAADQQNMPDDKYSYQQFPVTMPDGSMRPGQAIKNEMSGKLAGAPQFQFDNTPHDEGMLPEGHIIPGQPTDIPVLPPDPAMQARVALKNAAEGTLNRGFSGAPYGLEDVGPGDQWQQVVNKITGQRTGNVIPTADLAPKEVLGTRPAGTFDENGVFEPKIRMDGKMNSDGTISPEDLQRMKEVLGKYGIDDKSPLSTDVARGQMAQLTGAGSSDEPGLKAILENAVPELKKINPYFSGLLDAEGDTPQLGGITGIAGTSDSALVNEAKMQRYLSLLPEDQRTTVEKTIRDYAERNRLRGSIEKEGIGTGFEHFLMGNAKSFALASANRVGLAANALARASQPQLQAVANAVMEKHGAAGQGLANALNEISNRDQIGRNAMMFAIQQNPQYRDMLHGITGNNNYDQKK